MNANGAEHVAMVIEAVLGRAPSSLEALAGGANNQVLRATLPTGPILAKVYYRGKADSRDRLGAEFALLSHLWRHGLRCIPEPLHADRKTGIGLYGFVEGIPVEQDRVRSGDVAALSDLLAAMWRLRDEPGATALATASDSTFSSADLFAQLDRRIERILAVPPSDEISRQAHDFLLASIAPTLAALRDVLAKQPGWDESLPQRERTLSPSDHGFHNAIRTPTAGLVFVDFEYGGWDDPAKMMVDACLQPRIPLPECERAEFLRGLHQQLGASPDLAARLHRHYPLWVIKWCLILLNEFVPSDRARRRFAGVDSAESGNGANRRTKQLEKASDMLNKLHESLPDLDFLPRQPIEAPQ